MEFCKECCTPMVGVWPFSKNKHEKFCRCLNCYRETKHQKVKDNKLCFKQVLHNEYVINYKKGEIIMTEEMIINLKDEREKLIQRIDILEKVKELLLIPGTDFATLKQVSDFYEVGEEAIQKIYQRNKDEFNQDGVCNKKAKDFLDWTKCPGQRGSVKMLFSNGEIIVISNSGTKIFPRRAILRVGMLLRDSEVTKEVRNQLLNIEEKSSKEKNIFSIENEEKLLMDITLAYKSGEIDSLMSAIFTYNQSQSEYIKKLEPKARLVDAMLNSNSSVTTTISERIKKKDIVKEWKRKTKDNELNKREIMILSFIHDFINQNGYSPSVREIREAVGIKSTSSVHAYLDKLNFLGYIVKEYKKTRNIRINEDKYIEVAK